MKITFIGAGSTVFAKNVVGDIFCTPCLGECEIALYDIDKTRLSDSYIMINALNKNINNSRATVKKYLGVEERKEALKNASFVINAIQVGGYDPCTITDFEIPKKYGLLQTIGDTMGIGGIFRALRTIPVMESIARDIEEVCPDALFINYTNPMAILTGYMQRFTNVKTIGICHSVQYCVEGLLENLELKEYIDNNIHQIAGINHMAWLLSITDKNGNDLYPLIRKKAKEKNETQKHDDMVRFEYIDKLGYYCTESSEHNAEYNQYFIKSKYPELIDKYNIPIDEYLKRCQDQINEWEDTKKDLVENSDSLTHKRTKEYPSYIIEAIVTNTPYKIGANVINNGLIDNLPHTACVEVPCLVDATGINPCKVGTLPTQLAAMNINNINTQLLTIEAAREKSKSKIYQAAMMDPHTSSELSIDDIISMCDDLIKAHGGWLPEYK